MNQNQVYGKDDDGYVKVHHHPWQVELFQLPQEVHPLDEESVLSVS